jgi:hypothetical protein
VHQQRLDLLLEFEVVSAYFRECGRTVGNRPGHDRVVGVLDLSPAFRCHYLGSTHLTGAAPVLAVGRAGERGLSAGERHHDDVRVESRAVEDDVRSVTRDVEVLDGGPPARSVS